MHTTLMAPESKVREADTLGTRFTVAHDNWMADGDRFLLPVTHADATFWERWGAMRYVEDELLARFRLERDLVEALRAFLTAEMRERLELQADRLARLLAEFNRLARQRESARELAHTTRELLEALRLWYAEIEFAAGGIRSSDVSTEAIQLLAELNRTRCGWTDAHT
ncbi:MAG TPA: hypothetical protein VFU40_06800 [Gemmatimonadales bacterium]|nr:hypothetical protein [Gemmatimonadales bacterium]